MKADISSEVEGRGVEEEVTLPSLPRGLASLEIRTVFDQPELEALGRYDLIFTLTPIKFPSNNITNYTGVNWSWSYL